MQTILSLYTGIDRHAFTTIPLAISLEKANLTRKKSKENEIIRIIFKYISADIFVRKKKPAQNYHQILKLKEKPFLFNFFINRKKKEKEIS